MPSDFAYAQYQDSLCRDEVQLEHAPDNDDATYQSNKSEASAAIQSARSQEEKAFEGYTKQKNMGFFDDSTSFKQWAAQNAPGYQAAYQ